MKRDLSKVIDLAYELYMPQVRYEIEEFYDFVCDHYGFTKKSEPYNIVEIGTKFGGTFYLWCVMNQSTGLNISIDMNDGGLHGGIDEKKMDERDMYFEDRFENVKFIRGNSHDKFVLGLLETELYCPPQIITGVGKEMSTKPQNKIDFLFIDGDHTYDGVKTDFEMYGQFVKKGGIIAFHDIKDTQKHRDRQVQVARLWNEIIENQDDNNICIYNGQKYQVVEFVDNLVDWGGIGALIRL